MPRRNRPPKREVEPDIKYNSILVAQFINKLMMAGKKSTAQRIFYDALGLIEERAKRPGIEVFEQAIKNATPILEVKPRRVGGATYQVPVEVPPGRRMSLAIRWLVDTTRRRPGKSMAEKLANELMDAANNTGATIKKREDTHRMAEANRAFAHYRW
ncbi:MAG: 30S ribosomal protein S7 [Anaerolineae bacterium]|jgi:small subunit ribosomal protein S7